MSIFSKLFKLFVTVVLMPLIPMALLLGYYQHRQRATLLENHYNLAEIVSSELHHYVAELDGHLTFVPALTQALPKAAAVQAVLERALTQDPQWLFLAVFNPTGTEIARVLQGDTTADTYATDLTPAHAQDTRLHARITHADGATPSLEFVYPLPNGYWLYGRQTLPDLTDRLAQMRIGQTGQIYLTTPDGQLFAAPYQWVPQLSHTELAAQLKNKKLLIYNLKSTEGNFVGAFSSGPRLGVYTLVLQPKNEAFRSIYLSSTVLVLFLITIAVLAYFGALAFSRSLGEPIAQLIEGAKAVSQGNLDYRVREEIGWGEFQQLITSFNKMTADLKDYQALQLKSQVSEMKEQIYRAVAHDLRAPLIGLQGYIFLLSSGQVSEPEQKEYLDRMMDAAKNLSAMLEDVLAVSRVEAGVELPHKQKIEVADMIDSVVHMQQPAATHKALTVSSEIEEKLTISADPKLLRRIISNLLSNAIKFTPKGFIKIKAWQADRSVYISVQDSGIGLTEQQCQSIFEKFKQADARAEGYGLGLFISRQLAKAHGGDITVHSVVNQGSTFTVCLPQEDK